MYGVIDIGSNTIRLVVYKFEDGKIVPMFNKKCAVGLASYIDKDKLMKPSGIEKAVEALETFKEIIASIKLKDVLVFATASLRNINNTEEVVAYIKDKTDFDVRILTGDEEAVFDYYGAVQSTDINSGLLVDIGGGSTELVFYKDKEVVVTTSLPIGSLNLYKNYVGELIPTKKEINQIEKEVKKRLNNLTLPDYPLEMDTICGVGGTARAILKLLQDRGRIDKKNTQYSTDKLGQLVDLAQIDAHNLIELVLKTSADRVHTFIPGLVVLKTIANYYKSKNVITSDYGVREGYLYYILEERGIING